MTHTTQYTVEPDAEIGHKVMDVSDSDLGRLSVGVLWIGGSHPLTAAVTLNIRDSETAHRLLSELEAICLEADERSAA